MNELTEDKSNRPLVIYHANCADGFCAAWLMWRYWYDSRADYVPSNYGDAPPDVRGRNTFILDFSYPRVELLAIKDAASSLLVLDHHKTAEANLNGLDFCRFDMRKSGARMTWEYMSESSELMTGLEVPWLVDYTEDRDLWLWRMPSSRQINSALRSYPFTFDQWDKLANRQPRELIAEGAAINRAEQQIVEQHVRHAREIEMSGHTVLCVNATTQISEIAGELAKDRPFGVCWFEDDKGCRVYSLRSRDGGVDVSQIAERFGGGGHRNAAGFKVPARHA